MEKGKINVQTENIFPIIKKFLYSDHEIFLRELISNAIDATQKLKTLAAVGEFKGELGDLSVEVVLDSKAKTLSIIDKGIGMTTEEIEKYINQIAFSGAEEFVEKYKGQTEANSIIGHFGLGFYSSFMVSEKVEIQTKSFKSAEADKGVKWECDGSPEYSIKDIKKKERGTKIILHIAEDSIEFAEEERILGLLKKYCKFLPVEIIFGTETKYGKDDKDKETKTEVPRIINNTKPAWAQKPSDLKEEDYKSFYHELYPMTFDDPLFNIHLNVDYPFNLTGILYFPKVKKNFEVQRDKIQLYCNQVFVTDSVEGIVPDFLTLLHGVIDSPDIPLNVSRSFLQSDSNVKKISSHISKKVADKLEEIFKNNREDFEAKWDDIKVFIEYGMVSEDKFYERGSKFCLLKNLENKYFTLEEYVEHIKPVQTDKDGNVVHLYTNNTVEQHSFIQSAKERGYDVLVLDGPIDNHFINLLEQKTPKIKFARVDADVIDKLIQKEDALPSKLSEEEQKTLKEQFESNVDKQTYSVIFENMSETDQPVLILQPEFMRRMKDMSAVGGMSYFGAMPDQYNMVVNANHPLISKIKDETNELKRTEIINQTVDLALLAQNLLKGEKLTAFIKRSIEIIK
ncbi:MAG: molecular chaperone HtpG [Bacteroidetes bacterium]|nr:molecular chaperone HtpG [Bacteroidota bacterium]